MSASSFDHHSDAPIAGSITFQHVRSCAMPSLLLAPVLRSGLGPLDERRPTASTPQVLARGLSPVAPVSPSTPHTPPHPPRHPGPLLMNDDHRSNSFHGAMRPFGHVDVRSHIVGALSR